MARRDRGKKLEEKLTKTIAEKTTDCPLGFWSSHIESHGGSMDQRFDDSILLYIM
jgi:hypothetical protein